MKWPRERESVDPIVTPAQGHAALGALHWERSDFGAAIASYTLSESHYELAIAAIDDRVGGRGSP